RPAAFCARGRARPPRLDPARPRPGRAPGQGRAAGRPRAAAANRRGTGDARAAQARTARRVHTRARACGRGLGGAGTGLRKHRGAAAGPARGDRRPLLPRGRRAGSPRGGPGQAALPAVRALNRRRAIGERPTIMSGFRGALMHKLLSSIAIFLSLSIGFGSAPARAQVSPPELAARAWILVDMTTGQVLAEHNADERYEPASLTKVMTAYVVFRALADKRISLDQRPPVSERAYKAIGSRMFVEPNDPARVEDLLRGMIVQSGNDASIILAEAVAGTEEAFAEIMNQQAQRMGMTNTQFRNATGLPAPEHYSTARDLAISAMNLIRDFPEHYKLYSEKSFTYNNIKQGNRNRLLYVDPTVDGMKTGYTEAAGYCLITSALRPQPGSNLKRRLLSVVLGTASMAARAIESQKLLNWGYQNFDAVEVYA